MLEIVWDDKIIFLFFKPITMTKKATPQQQIKKMINEEAKDFLDRARINVKSKLDGALLSLLGLEKRGSDYEIDHCNNRNSVLIDCFRKMAEDEAKKIASSYKPSREDVIDFKLALEREFKSQMRYAIQEEAKRRAKEESEKLVSEIDISIEEFLAD